MTEKRFVNNGKDIFQYGEWWCSANGEHCADVIATAINELIEENEQLKQTLRMVEKRADKVYEENEQLKKELSEYKDFVLSDDKILCYTCLFCTHKGIYEVDCDVKGHVDVHGSCFSYTKKELQE